MTDVSRGVETFRGAKTRCAFPFLTGEAQTKRRSAGFNVVYFKLVYGRTYHNGRPCLSNCHLGLLSGHLQNNPVLKHQRGEQRDARVDPVRFGLVGRYFQVHQKVRAVACCG